MSFVLFNPTNDTIKQMKDGIEFVFPPGSKTQVSDDMGRFIIHKQGDWGMCSLHYGDEKNEERIAAAGRERRKAKKLRMIEAWNNDNYMRSETKRPPLRPSPEMIQWAEELGEPLYTPIPGSQSAERDRQARLNADNERLALENQSLREQMKQMSANMELIMAKLNVKDDAAAAAKMDQVRQDSEELKVIEQYRAEFRMLKGDGLKVWVDSHRSDWPSIPLVVQEEVRDKWKRIRDDEFPI